MRRPLPGAPRAAALLFGAIVPLAVAAGCAEEEKPAIAQAGMAGLSSSPASPGSGPAAAPANPDDKIVTVGESTLLRRDLDRAINSMLQAVGVPPDRVDAQMRRMVEARAMEAMIKRELMKQEAERRAHVVTPDEIDRAVQTFTKSLPEGLPFDTWLVRMSLTEEAFRDELRVNLLVRKVQEEVAKTLTPPTDDELKKVYDERKDSIAVVEKGRAHHILIAVAPDAPFEMAEAARKQAADLVAELRGKPLKTFQKKAREKSQDDKTKDKGGDLGTFEARGVLPDFWMAFRELKKGDVSEPVRTDRGFHIIYSQGTEKGDVRSFEELRPGILAEVVGTKRKEAMDKLLDGLTAGAKIERHYTPPPPPDIAAMQAALAGPPPGGPPGGAPGGAHPAGAGPGGATPGGTGMPMPPPGPGGMPHGMPELPANGELPLPSADNVLPGVRNPHGPGGAAPHGAAPAGAPAQPASPDDLRLGGKKPAGGGDLKLGEQ